MLDRIFFPVLIISIAFLAFVAGTFVILAKVFPYDYFSDAYQGMVSLYKHETEYRSPYQTSLWRKARTDERGVTRHDPQRAYNGLTLYASSHAQKAFLISMNGEVVHEWRLPFSKIWDGTEKKTELQPDPFVFWEDIHIYPNGDLLVIYVGMGDTPWGYSLIKMNKDSELIWKHIAHPHHDVDVADNDNIYLLTNEIRKKPLPPAFRHLEPPFLEDHVVILSPEGKQLKKVSILEALLKSPYARLLHPIAWNVQSDILHTNAVDLIDRELAAKLPFAESGQVLLSLRDLDTVAVLDLEKEEIVWARTGYWHRQHDSDILPNGNLLLFDNYGHFGEGGMSRVIEFDPTTLEIVWSYAGDEDHLFHSGIRSGQQRLPNGNTLINESDAGRILEVTPTNEIVWEYVNPVRRGEKDELIPVTAFGVTRIKPESLDPDFLETNLSE